MAEGANAMMGLGKQLAFSAVRTWAVDPTVLIERKQKEGPFKNMNGPFMDQVAEKAEELLLLPKREISRVEDVRGHPYLRPQVQLTAHDVTEWLTKFGINAQNPEDAHKLIQAYSLGSLRIVCLVPQSEGYPSYKKGKFAGYLEPSSKLDSDDIIPVQNFGHLPVPEWVVKLDKEPMIWVSELELNTLPASWENEFRARMTRFMGQRTSGVVYITGDEAGNHATVVRQQYPSEDTIVVTFWRGQFPIRMDIFDEVGHETQYINERSGYYPICLLEQIAAHIMKHNL
jgi:hypothetical protein